MSQTALLRMARAGSALVTAQPTGIAQRNAGLKPKQLTGQGPQFCRCARTAALNERGPNLPFAIAWPQDDLGQAESKEGRVQFSQTDNASSHMKPESFSKCWIA